MLTVPAFQPSLLRERPSADGKTPVKKADGRAAHALK